MNPADAWLVRHRTTKPQRLRLFCLPYAGGNSQIYRSYSQSLPGEVEVCAVQLPGREKRFCEPALESVEAIVDGLASLQEAVFDLPFAIFGHSLGAISGFELTRRLRATLGRSPEHLWVSGHRAPHLPDPNPLVHDSPDDELIEELRRLNGTPQEIFDSPELLDLLMPLIRADFTAAETYSYREGTPLACPITAFGGARDELVTREELEPWREHTRGRFRLVMLPGDHFFIHQDHDRLIGLLAADLEEILKGLPGRNDVR